MRLTQCLESRDGDGDVTVDGSVRSGSEDGWGQVQGDNSKSVGGSRSFGGVWCQYWTEAGQRAESAGVHSRTGPHQQDDGDEDRFYEETPLCGRHVPGANGKHELQETLEEWNGLFTRNRLKTNLEKTEVLHIGHQRE